MRGSRIPQLLVVLGLALGSAEGPGAAKIPRPAPALLLGQGYPIEIGVSFHAALVHWLDSLAALNGPGMTAGKTREAHRREYRERIGAPTHDDLSMLRRFAAARLEFSRAPEGRSKDALTTALFEAATMAEALGDIRSLLDERHAVGIESALEHFAPRYRTIWSDGRVPRRFVERSTRDPQRKALSRFLVDVASFYGVSPARRPWPRLVLVPVPHGYGTHAQAIGRNLLLEIRKGEGLSDEVAPIVHENAHFLFQRIDPARRRALRSVAVRRGETGLEAWRLLREALPTAIAQGVAGQRFQGKRWRRDANWYHLQDVDRFAKRLFPLVKSTLDEGGALDEALLERLLDAYSPITLTSTRLERRPSNSP